METRVKACRRKYSESVRHAHIGGVASASVAFAILTFIKLAYDPPGILSWQRVVLLPAVVYALVFAGMAWSFGRAMKTSRALDEADKQSLGSVGAQS